MKTIQLIGTCVVAATLLAACGGGDDDVVPVTASPNEVPASAGASIQAYTDYAVTQVQATSETAQPLSVDTIPTPPTSETAEPTKI